MEGGGYSQHSLWRHLPLLVQSNSKESVEYILQVLWRTRNTGLDSADRDILRQMLQIQSDSDLDPNPSKDGIQKLFPSEVPTELQKLLTILLQKFLQEWREDVAKEQTSLPRLKAMTCNVADLQNEDIENQTAIINLKFQSDVESLSKESDVKFQLTKETLETLLNSMYAIRDQFTTSSHHPALLSLQNKDKFFWTPAILPNQSDEHIYPNLQLAN